MRADTSAMPAKRLAASAVAFGAFALYAQHALALLDNTDHYNLTPWAGICFIAALIVVTLLHRGFKLDVSRHATMAAYGLAALLGLAYLLAPIPPVHYLILCAWQVLIVVCSFFWARHFAHVGLRETVSTVALGGLGASALLLTGLVSEAASIICSIVATACGAVALRHVETPPEPAADERPHAWPLPLVMLICTICSLVFASVLSNPYVINSIDHAHFDALFGIVLCALMTLWALALRRTAVTGFMLASLILLEIGLVVFAAGLSSDVTVPLSVINAADFLLYLLMFVFMAPLARSPRARFDWVDTYAIGLVLSSGAIGRLLGFVVVQTIDPPYLTLKTTAAVMLAVFAVLFLVFFSLELLSQRAGFEREVGEAAEAAQAQALKSIHSLSREDAVCRLAAEYSLTGREEEVLLMFAQGAQRRDIAEAWTVSENTVKYHVRNLFSKLDVHSAQEAVALVDQTALQLLKEEQ